jgi:polyphosphate kinase
VALIKKETEAGKSYYAYFGTGNFNEKTARIYADHGLLTSDKKLCKELQQVFLHLYKNKAIGKLKHLMVSQVNMKEKLLKLIDREIQIARMGKKAEVIIKLNNLEEPVMIEKLYEASMAGVRIKCLVRGICCLRPGVAPFSENIEVYRLVDNFLEHARIFVLNNQNKQEVFLSSADWMSRNLHRRVEVGFPINDGLLKTELLKLLELQIKDNCKLRKLTADGQNQKVQSKGKTLRAQLEFYHWLQKKEAAVVRARGKAV